MLPECHGLSHGASPSLHLHVFIRKFIAGADQIFVLRCQSSELVRDLAYDLFHCVAQHGDVYYQENLKHDQFNRLLKSKAVRVAEGFDLQRNRRFVLKPCQPVE